MSNGIGCTCYAYAEFECGCDADWTDQEIYDLRDEVKKLKATIADMQQAKNFAELSYNK